MAQLADLTASEMCAATGLHRNDARGQLAEKLQHLASGMQRRRILRQQIQSGVAMIDEVEACEMLGVPAEGQEAATPELPQILHFRVPEKWNYPAFQFDLCHRILHRAFVPILAAARAAAWSVFRLLNWMMRPHLDFDEVPADTLRGCGNEVLMAFLMDSATEYHGQVGRHAPRIDAAGRI